MAQATAQQPSTQAAVAAAARQPGAPGEAPESIKEGSMEGDEGPERGASAASNMQGDQVTCAVPGPEVA